MLRSYTMGSRLCAPSSSRNATGTSGLPGVTSGILEVTAMAESVEAYVRAFIITGAEGGALHRAKLATRYEEFEPASRPPRTPL